MNRKNMTAAVLAGLAGIAGIAGTAQAVNLNPDGLGQVLIYPYYTTNGGNDTLLSVVNTTDAAKAVKVRFLEGFNSREVLDFNLYLSANDVWVAAIFDDEGTPTLDIPDDSCTVPYLYGDFDGKQAFLKIAYNDNPPYFSNDGGPTGIDRAAEGHIEVIEMGTLVGDSAIDATHVTHEVLDDDDEVIDTFWAPADCDQLVLNWTTNTTVSLSGDWILDPTMDIERNSGGLFGGAAIINTENGTMYSYDAQAIQGYDKSDGLRHQVPGTILPSLNSGDQLNAWVFFGVPQNRAVELTYLYSVDAVSAVFMHENIMNEYVVDESIAASTEWVVTFPTKNFYVDLDNLSRAPATWIPDEDDPGCGGWVPGDSFPTTKPLTNEPIDGPGPWGNITFNPEFNWLNCPYVFFVEDFIAREPFTTIFDGTACELASLKTWDRDERTFSETRGGTIPPVVSPSIPGDCDPEIEFCEFTPFEFCYEVNVMRFGEGVIFGTPNLGSEDSPASLLLTVENEFENGWGRIDLSTDIHHQDFAGLVGLPVTGFAAYEFENDFVGDDDVKAFYGGLFGHKGNVRRKAQHVHTSSE